MTELNRICVFCGACEGFKPEYMASAKDMGKLFVSSSIGLIYGGGNVGLMGEIARTVVEGSGSSAVLGVIPHALTPHEVSGALIGEVVVVNDMHERKALMAKNADGFIALPGGFGTLEEVLEIITWQQLGFHSKPIGLLNILGFYDPLVAFFSRCVGEGFISQQNNTVIVSSDPVELLEKMRAFKPAMSLVARKQAMHAAALALIGTDVSEASPASESASPAPL